MPPSDPISTELCAKRQNKSPEIKVNGPVMKAASAKKSKVTRLTPKPEVLFAELERLVPDSKVRSDKKPERKAETDEFLKKMALVPDEERQFMVSVIRRAVKLDASSVSVDVDDVRNAFNIGYTKIKKMGEALDRYRIGTVDEVGTLDGNKYHVTIYDPSDHLTWFEINEFCDASGHDLDDFVLRLKFGLLDGPA
jgi:hypothetical protein